MNPARKERMISSSMEIQRSEEDEEPSVCVAKDRARKKEKRIMTMMSVITVTPKIISEKRPLALHSLMIATVVEGDLAMASVAARAARTAC